MGRRFVLVILAILPLTVLTAGCSPGVSPEDIYRFDSDCPLSGSAKNLVLEGGSGYLIIYGEGEGGDEAALVFRYGEPGHLSIIPEGASVDFTLEQIAISPCGIALNQGYFYFGEDMVLPAQVAVSAPPTLGWPEKLYVPYPDAPGSENIIIPGYSESSPKFAGLWWISKAVRLDVWKDGTIEVIREGVRACDDDGNWWISKQVGGEINAIVMVRDWDEE